MMANFLKAKVIFIAIYIFFTFFRLLFLTFKYYILRTTFPLTRQISKSDLNINNMSFAFILKSAIYLNILIIKVKKNLKSKLSYL
jgi:hypothetical protein